MLFARRPGGCVATCLCIETFKFSIQDSLFNCPADTLVATLCPPPIDRLKDCVAAGEAELEGLVQCTPLLLLHKADWLPKCRCSVI